MSNPFPYDPTQHVTRPWLRITEAKRATSTLIPIVGDLVVNDHGKLFIPDGTTQLKNLSAIANGYNTIVDNGDGTLTTNSPGIVDNGDGTISA